MILKLIFIIVITLIYLLLPKLTYEIGKVRGFQTARKTYGEILGTDLSVLQESATKEFDDAVERG